MFNKRQVSGLDSRLSPKGVRARAFSTACRSQTNFLVLWTIAVRNSVWMVKVCGAMFLAATLTGCSMTFPMAPFFTPGSGDDAAAKTPPRPLASLLDASDWRRAKTALSTALDPQGNGSLVGWDNPDSGNKGSFAPVGEAYSLDSKTCRVFLAKVDRKGREQSVQGTACADRQGEWTIAEAKL
jgi:17 kDa outer membrane surface antigen